MGKTLLLIALLGLWGTSAQAAGDATRGRARAAACATCHGADGNSPTAANPRLAGQYELSLFNAMMAYKQGKRDHALMTALLRPLSEQEIEDLAAYYASQACH